MNQNLADELVKMMAEDQRMLQQLFDSGELAPETYHPRMKALHEHNASRLKEIIGAHGWPGISLVGEEAAKAAWLVGQHSVSDPEFMGECVFLLQDAVAKEDIAGWQLAFLQDRELRCDPFRPRCAQPLPRWAKKEYCHSMTSVLSCLYDKII